MSIPPQGINHHLQYSDISSTNAVLLWVRISYHTQICRLLHYTLYPDRTRLGNELDSQLKRVQSRCLSAQLYLTAGVLRLKIMHHTLMFIKTTLLQCIDTGLLSKYNVVVAEYHCVFCFEIQMLVKICSGCNFMTLS